MPIDYSMKWILVREDNNTLIFSKRSKGYQDKRTEVMIEIKGNGIEVFSKEPEDKHWNSGYDGVLEWPIIFQLVKCLRKKKDFQIYI